MAIYQALRFDFDPPRAVVLTILQVLLTAAVVVAPAQVHTIAPVVPTCGVVQVAPVATKLL